METFPGRIACKLSILPRSISTFLRPPPAPPPRPRGWLGAAAESAAWEVCGNFSIPGTTRAPGRPSCSLEFESRGTPRFEPSPAVLRTILN